MYTTSGTAGIALGGAGLAATGSNLLWILLAAFALIGAGSALLRLMPRHEA